MARHEAAEFTCGETRPALGHHNEARQDKDSDAKESLPVMLENNLSLASLAQNNAGRKEPSTRLKATRLRRRKQSCLTACGRRSGGRGEHRSSGRVRRLHVWGGAGRGRVAMV
ncbi:hypothetical protein E2C01_092024 [Portunus trituberculatus]|uniref:Uncharacterized protein n=1 Tax=Portunus trituberculatus TaxID=210409 RepID=A0A5B7JUP4_PORTR|nr:hypothetical protein [Portunus trituberculatus]